MATKHNRVSALVHNPRDRFHGRVFTFRQYKNNYTVELSGSAESLVIRPINDAKYVVGTDGERLFPGPNDKWVAFASENWEGGPRMRGALTFGRTAEGAYLNAYGMIW